MTDWTDFFFDGGLTPAPNIPQIFYAIVYGHYFHRFVAAPRIRALRENVFWVYVTEAAFE